MVRHGGTWVLHLSGAGLSPSGFLARIEFLFFLGDRSLRTGLSTPPEWLPFPLPVTTVLVITRKGAESPGSGCIGLIYVLVFPPM